VPPHTFLAKLSKFLRGPIIRAGMITRRVLRT
jgi:hypothetical protein